MTELEASKANIGASTSGVKGKEADPPRKDSEHEEDLNEEEEEGAENEGTREATNARAKDNNLASIKLKILEFKGESDPELYLEWEDKVEKIFDIHDYSEKKKVKLVVVEFSGYASTSWRKLCKARDENGTRQIATWTALKKVMRAEFVPVHHKRELFQKLQTLTQGNKTVHEYYKEIELAMMWTWSPVDSSSAAIDVDRGLIFVATGNLYNAPEEVLKCEEALLNQTSIPSGLDNCTAPDVYFDSIIAFCLDSGSIFWATRLSGYDVYFAACYFNRSNPSCPPGPYEDADFGEAPMLLSIPCDNNHGKRTRDIVVAVQKSGYAWALDRDNGSIVWVKEAGPGSFLGGGIWGAATDGKRVYTNIANGNRVPFTLAPSNQITTAGGWVALDAKTGQILWTAANPSNETSPGPVTVANGVLFAGSVASNGPFYALDAKTGKILWSYNTGATIYGGASVSYGCVFFGHGYSLVLSSLYPTWTRGNSAFAFCVV